MSVFKGKSKKSIVITENIEDEKESEAIHEVYEDLRTLKITIKHIENIEPYYNVSDLFIDVIHNNVQLGQSEKVPLTDKELCPINYETSISFNIADYKSFDKFISSPLYLTLWQSPGEYNEEMYALLSDTSDECIPAEIFEKHIYEEILGVKISDSELEKQEHENSKVAKKSKSKTSTKGSGKSLEKSSTTNNKKKGKESTSTINKKKGSDKSMKKKTKSSLRGGSEHDNKTDNRLIQSLIVGSGNIDLLPLFLGETEFEESVLIHQDKIYTDDRIIPFVDLPRLIVNISVDKALVDVNEKLSNILHFSIESIFNLPDEFSGNLEYKIATVFPKNNQMLPYELGSGNFTETIVDSNRCKMWPDLVHIENFSSITNYRLESDYKSVKCKEDIDIEGTLNNSEFRVRWNTIRRMWLDEYGTESFKRILYRYRCWPIEIYITTKHERSKGAREKDSSKLSARSRSKSSGSSSKGSVQSKTSLKQPKIEPIHLMGFLDISTLLFPGVTKSRVACELKFFQLREYQKETGINESYFVAEKESVGKGNKSNKKEPGSSDVPRKSKDAGSKKGAANKSKNKASIKEPLDLVMPEVSEEPPFVPSEKVVNTKGESTFIIIEVELLKPLTEKISLEDLTNQLQEMLPSHPEVPKSVMSFNLAIAGYRDCIRTLVHEINKEYQIYSQPLIDVKNESIEPIDFLKHLKENGIYQKFTATLIEKVPALLNERFHFAEDVRNTLAHERHMSEAFVYLVNEMNVQVNSIMGCTNNHQIRSPLQKLDYWYCAKEAEQLEAFSLAERYYLQAISEQPRNPDYYFNYAVFLAGCKKFDRCCEYLKESLALKIDHKYSLLLFAILLFEKDDVNISEMVFSALTEFHPDFLEGWCCFYLFYMKRGNGIGCSACFENITRCTGKEVDRTGDYVFNNDELAWTTALCPSNNIWFQTAITLIKLRALSFADLALGSHNVKENGEYRYYQGVILYLMGDFEHALAHLFVAQKLHGPDFAVNSLIGHCQFRLGQFELAKESYEFITYSYSHPDDMHMLYVNLAILYEREERFDMARQYLLHAVKWSPTPYSWLFLGIIFYKEDNLKYAESCLTESNTLDNSLCENWAYLVLVNLRLGRNDAAQQCYTQLKKRKFHNEELLSLVEKEMDIHGLNNLH